MTKPSNFVMHTGYASLKNSAVGTLSVTIPNGSVINGYATRNFTADLVVGASGGSFRARGRINSGNWFPASAIGINMNMEIPTHGTGIIQNPTTAYIRWINATTVRLVVPVQNYADQPLYMRATYTIEFAFSTFLSPFTA
jgi:hypothetical protein